MQPPELLDSSDATLGMNCSECCNAIAANSTHWYGTDNAGPFCTVVCMRAAGKAGSLPSYVVEHYPVRQLGLFSLSSISAVNNPPPGCEARL